MKNKSSSISIFKKLKWLFSINYLQFLIIKSFSKAFWKKKKKSIYAKHKCIGYEEIISRKKSDKVYIFGSGYSFNDLTNDEIERIKNHDVITFNWGHFQDRFKPLVHLSRRVGDWNSSYYDNALINNKWKKGVNEYFMLLESNKLYQNSIIAIQWESIARATRYAINNDLINLRRKILPYQTDHKNICSFQDNDLLAHKSSTLISVINLAVKCKWKKIVLVCINLDQGYFWLEKDKSTDEQTLNKFNNTEKHSTVKYGILETLLTLKNNLAKYDIELLRHSNSNGLINILDIEEGIKK